VWIRVILFFNDSIHNLASNHRRTISASPNFQNVGTQCFAIPRFCAYATVLNKGPGHQDSSMIHICPPCFFLTGRITDGTYEWTTTSSLFVFLFESVGSDVFSSPKTPMLIGRRCSRLKQQLSSCSGKLSLSRRGSGRWLRQPEQLPPRRRQAYCWRTSRRRWIGQFGSVESFGLTNRFRVSA